MALKAGRVGVAPDQVNRRGEIVGAGLSPEQQAKLDRALLTPVQAPVEDKIVGVSTGRDQLMLGIGAGLAVEGGQLIGTEVPEYGTGEAGKVLKVNAAGELEWSDPPQGGGGITLNQFTAVPGYTINGSSRAIAQDAASTLYYYDIGGTSANLVDVALAGRFMNSGDLRIIFTDAYTEGTTGASLYRINTKYFKTIENSDITKKYMIMSLNNSEISDLDQFIMLYGPKN